MTILAVALGVWGFVFDYYPNEESYSHTDVIVTDADIRAGMHAMQDVIEHMYWIPQSRSPAQWTGFFHDDIDSQSGTALYSWRVIILSNREDYNFRQPWNSRVNRKWAKENVHRMPRVKPISNTADFSQMLALAGSATAFTEYGLDHDRNFYDCEADAILLIDCRNDSIRWMQPGDINLSELRAGDWKSGIGNLKPNYSDGYMVGFADGAVWRIRADVPREAISKFFTVESAKQYDRDEILSPYAIDKLPPLNLPKMAKQFEEYRQRLNGK